jgi:hypothetical protein
MAAFDSFLAGAASTDLAPAFAGGDRPVLAVDVPSQEPGVSLDKKSHLNALGARRPSVVRLVRDLSFPRPEPAPQNLHGLSDFATRMRVKVEDASPDSVVGVLFFAARQSGVEIPEEVWGCWEPAITAWETSGGVEDPERSWPALAAALAHTQLGGRGGTAVGVEALLAAWARVLPFAVEALRAGHDPRDLPFSAGGPHLTEARAALDEERARYERKLYAQQTHQLSLPMVGSDRARLADALFTTEDEFTGALKVFARNDRKNAPLGRGFTVLVLERPELRESEPTNWMTISLDIRRGVHLLDLWRELERLETAAWRATGRTRPLRTENSRVLAGAPRNEQRFHEQWYLDEKGSLLASPKRQAPEDTDEETLRSFPGSCLSSEQVRDAIFRVFDPFAQLRVGQREGETTHRLPDVPAEESSGDKQILQAWWPKHDPLPNPAGPTPYCGLFPGAFRVMAARTLGVPAEQALAEAPNFEDFDVVPFGNGLAVVTDGGVYLLDSGRSRPARIARAVELVRDQARIAADLDRMQSDIERRAHTHAEELKTSRSIHYWLDQQRFCANLHAELIHLRGARDTPLETQAAGLQGLKDTLSRRWNIKSRLHELGEEIEWLQRNGREAEELRIFRAGRWAAALALAIVASDALASRIAPLLATAPLLNGLVAGQIRIAAIELASLFVLLGVTLGLIVLGSWALRTRVGESPVSQNLVTDSRTNKSGRRLAGRQP